MALQPFVRPWPLIQFRNHFYADGRTPWTSDQPVAKPLPIRRTTRTQNKHTHRHPCLKRDPPTIRAFERAKTFRPLDRTSTVIGTKNYTGQKIYVFKTRNMCTRNLNSLYIFPLLIAISWIRNSTKKVDGKVVPIEAERDAVSVSRVMSKARLL
jgi:hypothetical protein